MGKLDNKTAIITGAGDGIGRVIAQTFAREGASIVIADISEEMGSETERLIKESGGAVKLDPMKPNVLILMTGKIGLKEKSIFIREKLEELSA